MLHESMLGEIPWFRLRCANFWSLSGLSTSMAFVFALKCYQSRSLCFKSRIQPVYVLRKKLTQQSVLHTQVTFESVLLTVFIPERWFLGVELRWKGVGCLVSQTLSDFVVTYQCVSPVSLDELFLNSDLVTETYPRRPTPGPGLSMFYSSDLPLIYLAFSGILRFDPYHKLRALSPSQPSASTSTHKIDSTPRSNSGVCQNSFAVSSVLTVYPQSKNSEKFHHLKPPSSMKEKGSVQVHISFILLAEIFRKSSSSSPVLFAQAWSYRYILLRRWRPLWVFNNV